MVTATFGLLFLAIGFVRDWLLDRMLEPIHLVFMAFFAVLTALALRIRPSPDQ